MPGAENTEMSVTRTHPVYSLQAGRGGGLETASDAKGNVLQ